VYIPIRRDISPFLTPLSAIAGGGFVTVFVDYYTTNLIIFLELSREI